MDAHVKERRRHNALVPPPLLDQLTRWYLEDLERHDTADGLPLTADDQICGLLQRMVEAPERELGSSWLPQLSVLAGPQTAAVLADLRRHPATIKMRSVTEVPALLSVGPTREEVRRLDQFVREEAKRGVKPETRAARLLREVVAFGAGAATGGVLGNAAYDGLKKVVLPATTSDQGGAHASGAGRSAPSPAFPPSQLDARQPTNALIQGCGAFAWDSSEPNWPRGPAGQSQIVRLELPPGKIIVIDGDTIAINAFPELRIGANEVAQSIALDNGWRGTRPDNARIDVRLLNMHNVRLVGTLANPRGMLDPLTEKRIILDRLNELAKFHPGIQIVRFQVYRAAGSIPLETFNVRNTKHERSRRERELADACWGSTSPSSAKD